jgi:hypothetical protein
MQLDVARPSLISSPARKLDGPVFRKLPCRLIVEAALQHARIQRSLIIGSYY